MRYETYSPEIFNRLVDLLLKKQIGANYFQNYSNHYTNINFAIKSTVLDKFQNLLEDELKSFETTYTNISRVSIIGHGIMNDDSILEKIMKIVELNQLEILNLEINESKIAILFSKKLSNNILEQLHKTLI